MNPRKLEIIALLDKEDLTTQEKEIRAAMEDIAAFCRNYATLLSFGRMFGFEVGLSDELRKALFMMQGDKENGQLGINNTMKTTE